MVRNIFAYKWPFSYAQGQKDTSVERCTTAGPDIQLGDGAVAPLVQTFLERQPTIVIDIQGLSSQMRARAPTQKNMGVGRIRQISLHGHAILPACAAPPPRSDDAIGAAARAQINAAAAKDLPPARGARRAASSSAQMQVNGAAPCGASIAAPHKRHFDSAAVLR